MENSRFADVNGEFTITAADNTGYSLVFYCGTIGIVNTFGSVLAEFDADDIPAADVVPLAHGQWKPYQTPIETRQSGWICSKCSGVQHELRNGKTDFCPNCGALMDEDENDG